jgi:hypothetical protein
MDTSGTRSGRCLAPACVGLALLALTGCGTTKAPASTGHAATVTRAPRQPAAPAIGWAGQNDFGYAKAVVRTTGAPCLSVDRLTELRGPAAAAWVARHPDDASMNDLPVIADEDGPRLLCLPLAAQPAIQLTIEPPDGQGIQLHAATLSQLSRLLADPLEYGRGAPTWFMDVSFYRWHYDKSGNIDRVTSFWTP